MEKPDVPFNIGDIIYQHEGDPNRIKVLSWETFEFVDGPHKGTSFKPDFVDVRNGWGLWKRDEVSRVKSILNNYE